MTDHRPAPGSGGIYGRRTGRKLHTRQTALMADVLPRLDIRLKDLEDWPSFLPRSSDVRLEIGFGGGEHLVHHARQRPEANFIGCEPFRNGVAKLLELIATERPGNIRVFTGDAALLIDNLPGGVLTGVDLFYPDPWPKRRQRKRRFVSDETLSRLARVMKAGAHLRFATDIDDYAGWTLARILRSRHFRWHARRADDWRIAWPDWPSTRYEAKAFREGRAPAYFNFERTEVAVTDA